MPYVTILNSCLHLVKPSYPIKCQCCSHIETSQFICCANQLTGFYMRATLAFNGLILAELNQLIKLYSLGKLKIFTLILTLTTCQLLKQHLKST